MPVVTLRPDRFAAGGEAIARDDGGRVVFVRGALPGEVVDAELTVEKKDWARALTVAVEQASPDRVTPPCPSRRAGCGGCGWQHLTVDGPAPGTGRHRHRRPAPHRRRPRPARRARGRRRARPGYRTTIRVAATADGRAGFRAEHSHDVVAAPECLDRPPDARRRCCRRCGSIPTSSRRCGCRWPPASWRPAGTTSAGTVRGPARVGTLLGARGHAVRGRRRPPAARVDGLVLPVRPAGRRAARRHGAPGRARAGRRRPRRRRLRRGRHVRRLR